MSYATSAAGAAGSNHRTSRQQYIDPHALINSNSLETVHSEHVDPRPQSVLSLHSSLSNPDVPDDSSTATGLCSPLLDDLASLASNSLEPIDEDYISASGGEGDDDDDDETDRDNESTIDVAERAAEELKLQTKIADLRTKKEEMLSLVRELQTMNERSASSEGASPTGRAGSAAATPPALRSIPIQFERIVPIELVPAARPKSTSVSPSTATAATAIRVPIAVAEVPALRPLAIAKEDTLNQKLSEINALKQKLNRLQDMMNTVNSIEKQNDAPLTPLPSAAQAIDVAVGPARRCAAADADEEDADADDDVDPAEEELENRVKSIQTMTQDLRLQSASLAAERDRLRDIKNELSRRNELKDSVMQDLERHVATSAKPPSGSGAGTGDRRPSLATFYADADADDDDGDDDEERTPIAEPSRADAGRLTFNDLSGSAEPSKLGFKKSLSEEPWRRGSLDTMASSTLPTKRYAQIDGGGRVKTNVYPLAYRYGLDGDGDVTTQTTSADGSEVSDGSKFGGGGIGSSISSFMPPPMRSLDTMEPGLAGWRKNASGTGHDSGAGLAALGSDGSSVCRPAGGCGGMACADLAASPQCAYHHQHQHHQHSSATAAPAAAPLAAASAAAPHQYSFNDPMLLQQFIQTQQMLINSVSQCNQLLWDQQRDINNLNSAVILLQERILNFANARTETASAPVPTARAESVPPVQLAANPLHTYNSYRAQSEQHNHHQCCSTPAASSAPTPTYPQVVQPQHAPHQSPYPRHYSSSTALSYAQPLVTNSRPPLPHQHQSHHSHQHQHQHANPSTGTAAMLPPRASSATGTTQFPLPPPHNFHRSDRSSADIDHQPHQHPSAVLAPTHHHHQHQHTAYLNNNPNSPLFNGSPNPQQQQQQQQQPLNISAAHVPAASASMFVYHNNNHSAGSNAASSAANNLGASNINSNHTIAANLNSTANCNAPPYGMQQQQQQQQQQPQQQPQQPITLNNQVPPGNRANNYWDNFRSYSRQNLLSTNNMPCKSNENVCTPVQHLQHQQQPQPPPLSAASSPQQLSVVHPMPMQQQQQPQPQPHHSPSSASVGPYPRTDNAAAAATIHLRNTPPGGAAHLQLQQHHHHHLSHNILPVMDNKYFMHFRNQIHHDQHQHQHQLQQQQQQQQQQQHQQQQQQYYYDEDDNMPRQSLVGTYQDTLTALINEHNKHPTQQSRAAQQPPPSNVQQRYNNVQTDGNDDLLCSAAAMQQLQQQQQQHQQQQPFYAGNGSGDGGCGGAAAAVDTDYPLDLNLSSRRMPDKPSEKLFDAFKDDVYTAVSQLIAANESRPEFLISLFQELQQLSRNDPLRARLMQAFEELELRQVAEELQRSPTPQQQPWRHRSNPPTDSTAEFNSADSLVCDIVNQVEHYLHDARQYPGDADDANDTIMRQRAATIVMRELYRASPAHQVQLYLTREELLRSMPPLDLRLPLQFLTGLLRYLQQRIRRAAADGVGYCDSGATGGGNKNVHESMTNRRKRRQPQKSTVGSTVAPAALVAVAVAPAAPIESPAEPPRGLDPPEPIVNQQQPQQPLDVLMAMAMMLDEASGGDGHSDNANEDLAEADQMCGSVSEDDNDEEGGGGAGGGSGGGSGDETASAAAVEESGVDTPPTNGSDDPFSIETNER